MLTGNPLLTVQGHDFLGKVSVDLAALLNERPDAKATDSMWLPLLNRKGAKGKGELRIGLEFLSAAQAQQVGLHLVSQVPSSDRGSHLLQGAGTPAPQHQPWGAHRVQLSLAAALLAAVHCLPCVLAERACTGKLACTGICSRRFLSSRCYVSDCPAGSSLG